MHHRHYFSLFYPPHFVSHFMPLTFRSPPTLARRPTSAVAATAIGRQPLSSNYGASSDHQDPGASSDHQDPDASSDHKKTGAHHICLDDHLICDYHPPSTSLLLRSDVIFYLHPPFGHHRSRNTLIAVPDSLVVKENLKVMVPDVCGCCRDLR
ncbi:hypothetical protein RND81_08G108000 [Saponaria officinalis]|uniref:Uncharacterized protein n=1 Tax=Saponaria officinalis TaxID=3572 RepID=A0AAW1J6U6_SAPOF